MSTLRTTTTTTTAPNVIDLDSRRPQTRSRDTCAACERARGIGTGECYPHRLDSLATRLRRHVDRHDGQLLTPTVDVAETIADALTVLDRITAESLTVRRAR